MRVLVLLVLLFGLAASAARADDILDPIALPNGEVGIGFDDLLFAPALGRVLVPAGRTGRLDLVDPVTLKVEQVPGFGSSRTFTGGHSTGTTSADWANGRLIAIDRTRGKLVTIDPTRNRIVAEVALSGSPGYVRWVQETQEAWVTEPDSERIEIFRSEGADSPQFRSDGEILVPGGPESLVIDNTRHLAYTHLWRSATVAVGLRSRRIEDTWRNGCRGSRGIALDESHGWLFAGCAEGRAIVLDVIHDGERLDARPAGAGVDIIAYSPSLRHLYIPGSRAARMAIYGVKDNGKLDLLGSTTTATGAHCAAADDRGQVFVCDPDHGRLLLYRDPHSATQ